MEGLDTKALCGLTGRQWAVVGPAAFIVGYILGDMSTPGGFF